jgi:hypothetical protein
MLNPVEPGAYLNFPPMEDYRDSDCLIGVGNIESDQESTSGF